MEIQPMFNIGTTIMYDPSFIAHSLERDVSHKNLTEGKNYEVLDVQLAFSKYEERVVLLDDLGQQLLISPLWFESHSI